METDDKMTLLQMAQFLLGSSSSVVLNLLYFCRTIQRRCSVPVAA
jgi:hypothetical protein